MDINYFIRKQELILARIETTFLRKKYFNYLNSSERLIALIGARGVGKTTLLFQYIKANNENSLYMTGDDIEFTNSSIYELTDEFYSLGGRVIVIDEVHKYKNWAQEIKNIYDSFPDLTIRISGSSMINILYEKYDLSRRLVIHNVPVLSFKEYFEIQKGIELDSYSLQEILTNSSEISKKLVFKYQDLYGEFKNYLQYGAYPFYLEGQESFNSKLYNALEKIIHEDIPSLNKIDYTHITVFEKLIFFVVSANNPFDVNVTALSRKFDISVPTLNTYLSILDKTAIFKSMRKFSTKISKKPQKILFANTNILYAYADKINLDLDIGAVRETFFVNCFKNIYYSDIGDFKVDKHIFEIGGKNKSFSQIKDIKDSYLAIDIDFTSNNNKIPLWLFSFIK